jgi:hypothetical protein
MFLIFSVSETSWLYFFLPWCSITYWLRVVIICSSSLYLQTFRQLVQFWTINNETTESIRFATSCILFNFYWWFIPWLFNLSDRVIPWLVHSPEGITMWFSFTVLHIMSSIKVRHQLYLKITIMLWKYNEIFRECMLRCKSGTFITSSSANT